MADDHDLYHKHFCFSQTTSDKISTETEFFHAAEGTVHTSYAPSLVSKTPTEQSNFEFSLFTVDGKFADPEYESHLAKFTLGPRKHVKPIGVQYFKLHNVISLIHLDRTVLWPIGLMGERNTYECIFEPEYHCRDCFDSELYCKDCMVERHCDNPLHRIKVYSLDCLSLGALTIVLALE